MSPVPGRPPALATCPRLPASALLLPQCTIIKTIDGDKDVWAYDKRFHTSLEESLKVPMIPTPPDFQKGWKTIEGVTRLAGLPALAAAWVCWCS